MAASPQIGSPNHFLHTEVVPFCGCVLAPNVGSASDHTAGNGVSSSGAGAIKWCCGQCISATGAGGAASVGTD